MNVYLALLLVPSLGRTSMRPNKKLHNDPKKVHFYFLAPYLCCLAGKSLVV